jgi:putative Flp pilus-assembly TadE/G-like protein
MKTNRWNWKPRSDRRGEAGQAVVFFLLAMGIFLLGALCFAFDISNMWFHRQAAQTAADAACAAGAMDILVDAQGGATGNQGFTLGTNYSCTAGSTDSVCSYAAMNGYNSDGAFPGNQVSVSFPTTAANGAPPGVPIPDSGLSGTTHPFIRVDVLDHVQTFFIGLLNGGTTADVRAFATCGVEFAAAPIPLIVLHPTNPGALTVQGNSSNNSCDPDNKNKLCIWGGPQQSIQVDSSDPAATSIGGSAKIDLSKGGPSNTGSDLGTWGGPIAAPGGFLAGSTGSWRAPSSPINDPFASLAVPDTTGMTTYTGPYRQATPADLATLGIVCPDTTCDQYAPGIYSKGLCVGNGPSPCSCPISAHCTAIFDPGVYIIQGDFSVVSNSCLRPSGAAGDGSGGVMFYFTGGGSVSVAADSGSKCQADFITAGYAGTSSLLNGIKCASGSHVPSNLASITSLSGNVLLAPCSGTYGDPFEAKGLVDPDGEQHGFLMFQDRTVEAANQNWGGGGSMLLAGTMYFHNSTDFSDVFKLNGNSGSSTYVLGDIVADNVILKGDSQVTMDLNTSVVFSVLKASIFQ